ncbi:ABC-type nitrate/sulfonate/bicarbonate transport system, permease component [Rubidibacter lacunae KORDI 51-2]|uniref:ABC-type nitrate/sulfonate/bicarbonate transport system, permease component n=1 Tax=Rubidibacter lacunae KORDI 51-2 TaxID=582515 RepID=U5D969_9CHRO|nr:ABC transporter permease [Rubidibacter lacunae]ERN41118.1 ABC-type nitrate/sulfonate/bicarbonate transport system, permease component [Rubidibacter lacunae KORDI 51-2]
METIPKTASERSQPLLRGLPPTLLWGIAEEIPKALSYVLAGLSIALPFAAWWALSNFTGINSAFLPTPQQVVGAFGRLYAEGHLLQDTLASCLRVAAGFGLAALLSVPLGITMGAFASIRALVEPLSGLLRYMPAPAFVPLLIIYLGVGEEPKIALIFIGTVFFNILMIMDAVKFVPKELIETAYTLGGSRLQVLLWAIAPYVVPNIIDTFRINIATSWSLVVVAELVAAEQGLGKRILIAQKFLNTDEIFACLIVLGAIGVAIDLSFRGLLRATCRWSTE